MPINPRRHPRQGHWRSAENTMSDSVDRAFGEHLRIIPMVATPNARPTPDTSRRNWLFVGYFESRRKQIDVDSPRTDRMTQNPRASVDLRAIPYEVARGDRLERVTDQQLYAVDDISPDGEGRVWLGLSHLQESKR